MSRCMIIGWIVCIYATLCIHCWLMYKLSCDPIAISFLASSSKMASSMLYPSMNSFTRWTADGSFAMARNCTIFGCRRRALIPTSDTLMRNICSFPRFGILIVFMATSDPAQCRLRTVPNAPCPNVCIDVQFLHQNRTLLVPMYVSMFNSSTRTERSLSQCMYRCSTPPPEPNAPCPNVCIDVQLLHQNRTLLVPVYVSMFNSSTRTSGTETQVLSIWSTLAGTWAAWSCSEWSLFGNCASRSGAEIPVASVMPMIEIGFDTSVTFPLPVYTANCYDFLHTKQSYIRTPRVSLGYIGLNL